jgi:hypothetical protein
MEKFKQTKAFAQKTFSEKILRTENLKYLIHLI